MDENDSELYQKYRNGDEAAFDELIRRYDEPLIMYLYGILHDYHDAEDIMVEAFARILEKKPRIEEGCFKSYLFKTGRNLAINLLKHLRRHEQFSIEGMNIEAAPDASPDKASAAADQKVILKRCLNRIDEELREVLYLIYLDELSYREAAGVLKVNTKRIDNLLERGKKRMREELKKEGVTDPFI